MAHPSEYYLKFLLAQEWGDDDIEETLLSLSDTLKSYGLLPLLESQYDLLRANFTPPEHFKFHNQRHLPTTQFMKKHKIYTLWRSDKDTERVFKELIDGHQLMKTDLHILLMGRLPEHIIADKLNSKYRPADSITDQMVAIYRHFFWNVSICSQGEWEDLLHLSKNRDALISSLYCGEQQALYRAGFNPRVDNIAVLKEAYRQGYFRLQALRYMDDTKGVIDAYTKLTARLLNIYEVLNSQGAGLHDQLQQFRSILMKHKDPDVKKVDDLINKLEGGSFSGDGSTGDDDDDNAGHPTGDLQ